MSELTLRDSLPAQTPLQRGCPKTGGIPVQPFGTCLAQPPDRAPYRGWDHRWCTHPTPIPTGWRRCPGDPGCETRLPAGTAGTCGYHRDWGATSAGHAWNALMGSPHRADGLAE